MPTAQRHDRLDSEPDEIGDPRSPFKHDRDRALHAPELRRLGKVTQVTTIEVGENYHNRLTHTLKVAQIARRLAEMFLVDADQRKLAKRLGGLDPDVVETAALLHDMGHAPYGHSGEHAVDSPVTAEQKNSRFIGSTAEETLNSPRTNVGSVT